MGVGAGGEVREVGGSFRQTGQHGVTVRDGFVAGKGKRASKAAGRANELRIGRHRLFHSRLQRQRRSADLQGDEGFIVEVLGAGLEDGDGFEDGLHG